MSIVIASEARRSMGGSGSGSPDRFGAWGLVQVGPSMDGIGRKQRNIRKLKHREEQAAQRLRELASKVVHVVSSL